MSVSVTDVLDDGLERLVDKRLLPAFLALYAVHLGIVVGTQSQLAAQREDLASEALFGEELLPEQFPLALEVPLGVAWLVWFVALILFVTASMIAFRALLTRDHGVASTDGGRTDVGSERVGDSSTETAASTSASGTVEATASTDVQTSNLLLATLHGLAAAIIGTVVVGTGLVLLVVPGLFLASALAFTHPYIAREQASAIDAMKRSFETTSGYRLRVFGVLVGILLTFLAISFLGGFATLLFDVLGAPVVGELVNVAFSALAWLAALAILASAFERLESVRAEKEAKWDGIDEELLP